jgi:hypothetical protein
LTSLIRPVELAIKDFVDERSEIVRIHGVRRMRFGCRPSPLSHLWRRIPTRVGNQASVALHARSVFVSQPLDSKLLTSRADSLSLTLLRTSKPPSFHSPLSVVYMEPTLRLPCFEVASSLMNFSVCWSISALEPP